ncbi:wall-associated receptor kinase 2-like [Humulus lupulus]|uniref:wall-associated receptor kinase 2-like n=1 Tax=Humulus lupulus TaxID=3486 RepID=UPI002B40149B|nr:wall-associated receptor kinase 2-like [Humulus lupulus]
MVRNPVQKRLWFSKPFVKQITELKVLMISINHTTLLTENPINFFNCSDNKKSPNQTNRRPANLTLSPFSYSESRNRLTVVGCDVFGYIDSSPDDVRFQAVGCSADCIPMNKISLIDGHNNNSYGSCYGRNCCQTILPSYLESYEINIGPTNHCSYAFVVDNDWLSNASSTVVRELLDYVPVTLDWDFLEYINDYTNMTSPLKPKYSHCYLEGAKSSIEKMRLQCMCKEGYRGNPYLLTGCQDIDECVENSRLCPDDQICENTIGSHRCKYKTVHKIRPILVVVIPRFRAMINVTSKAGFAANELVKSEVCFKIRHRACKAGTTSNMVASKSTQSRRGAPEMHLPSGMTSDQGFRA